jgi:hypothetical protein
MTGIQVVTASAISLIGALAKYEVPAGPDNLWYIFVETVQGNSFWTILVLSVGLLAATIIKTHLGNPWVWEMVKGLLDDLRDDVFEGQNVFAHCDRVTLFKKRSLRMRWGLFPSRDWLCSVERSGHMTRGKRKGLRIKDNAAALEGVGGATWGLGKTILADDLPILTQGATDQQICNYAMQTFVEPDYVRSQLFKGAILPRSLCGIIVEVNHEPWGVIVIDSALPKLPQKEQIEKFFQKNAKVLGKLLAKV